MNFARHFLAVRRLSLAPYRMDPEILALLRVLGASVLLVTLVLLIDRRYPSGWESLRHAAFAVVSIATTTGFVSEDYEKWPAFVAPWLLFLSCLCCNTGSTGGGIKMFRTLLLGQQAMRELRLMVHPQAVEPVRIGGLVVANRVAYAVLAFIFLYFMTVVVLTFALLLSGLDFVSSFSGVIASVNNTGPGLNAVGPSSSYQSLTDFQTWVYSIAMLLGRLPGSAEEPLVGLVRDVEGDAETRALLETIVDPDETILEANESNNCGSVLIQLSGMGTDSPSAELLGKGPPC